MEGQVYRIKHTIIKDYCLITSRKIKNCHRIGIFILIYQIFYMPRVYYSVFICILFKYLKNLFTDFDLRPKFLVKSL
jgi:hypothetical protein